MTVLQTRSLTEGAMLAAITVVLAFLGIYIGFISILVSVPLILLVYRHGFRPGMIVSVAAALLTSLVIGTVLVALDILFAGLMGMAVGMALRERFSFPQVFVVGIAASGAAILLQVLTYSLLMGQNLLELYLETWQTSSDTWLSILEHGGFSEDMLRQYESTLGLVPELLRLLAPVLLVAMAVLRSFLTLFTVRLVLRRLGVEMGWFPPFILWRFPWYVVWGFILGRLFLIIDIYAPAELWTMLRLNLEVVSLYLFFIQGLAIIWFYLHKYRIHTLVRVGLVLMLLLTGGFWILIIGLLGLLDIWLDVRKLRSDAGS